jgi:hypothetical protein
MTDPDFACVRIAIGSFVQQITLVSRPRHYGGLFAVRACETNYGTSRREDFWFIVAARSEDEAEIRTGQGAGRPSH